MKCLPSSHRRDWQPDFKQRLGKCQVIHTLVPRFEACAAWMAMRPAVRPSPQECSIRRAGREACTTMKLSPLEPLGDAARATCS